LTRFKVNFCVVFNESNDLFWEFSFCIHECKISTALMNQSQCSFLNTFGETFSGCGNINKCVQELKFKQSPQFFLVKKTLTKWPYSLYFGMGPNDFCKS